MRSCPVVTDLAGWAESDWPILVCLLGSFRVMQGRQPVPVRGEKAEALLCSLALRQGDGVPRELLLEALWPRSEPALAAQSLNSLVYSLHRRLGDALGGEPPVLHGDGTYRLNTEAGVGLDLTCFEALARAGHEVAAEDPAAGAALHVRAVGLYRGDLCTGSDVAAIVERERLRASYLTLLARLADFHYAERDYAACLEFALRLLVKDPCREDGHRAAMRCYVRLGERAQALRQYRLCSEILRAEFDAPPEPATTALFELIRRDPGSV